MHAQIPLCVEAAATLRTRLFVAGYNCRMSDPSDSCRTRCVSELFICALLSALL